MKHQKDYYRGALFAARVEREKLFVERGAIDHQRAEIEKQIKQLDQTILGLKALSGEVDLDATHEVPDLQNTMSLADACRAVLNASDRYLSASRIRHELAHAKYPLDERSKNPLSAIHGILKRFVESGEAQSLEIEGKIGYRLNRVEEAEQAQGAEKK